MGRQHPGKAERLELRPHPRDVHRKTVGLRLEGDAPHIGQQLAAGQALARLFGEPPQQLEFARVQAEPAISTISWQ